MKLPHKTNGFVGDYGHPRFIAAMLCFGDLLDLDTDRFNEELLKITSPLPESSKLHYLKHKAIRHFLVTPKEIEIVSYTNCDDVNRELRNWTDWLQSTVNYLALNWATIVPEDFGQLS